MIKWLSKVRENKQSEWMKGLLEAERLYSIYFTGFEDGIIDNLDRHRAIEQWLKSDVDIDLACGSIHIEFATGYTDYLIHKREEVLGVR